MIDQPIHWTCGLCGFDLAGHPHAGRCPECKGDVAELNLYRTRFRRLDLLLDDCRFLVNRQVVRLCVILACSGLLVLSRWTAFLVVPLNLVRFFLNLQTSAQDYLNARRQVLNDSDQMLAAFDWIDDPRVLRLQRWATTARVLAVVHTLFCIGLTAQLIYLFL